MFFGCGAAVIAGMAKGPTGIDVLGISFAFGLAIVAMADGIGPVSGCHVNPAVSFGVMLAGRMSMGEFINYVIAQCLGALAGAAVLYRIASGKASIVRHVQGLGEMDNKLFCVSFAPASKPGSGAELAFELLDLDDQRRLDFDEVLARHRHDPR